jgi:hypothetical protein
VHNHNVLELIAVDSPITWGAAPFLNHGSVYFSADAKQPTGERINGAPFVVSYEITRSPWADKVWVLNKDKQAAIDAQVQTAAAAQAVQVAQAAKKRALDTIVVMTKSGKSFVGNEAARNNMLAALQAAEITEQTEAGWKLADNSVATVTVAELKEALVLSIKRVGEIVAGG